ncbi:RasGEF [Chytridiales sp. JEL 0842]|nr:RasGEF [Chytridiales sp. JEL 0842]
MTASTNSPNSLKDYPPSLTTPVSPIRSRIGSIIVKNSGAFEAISEKMPKDLFELLGFTLCGSNDETLSSLKPSLTIFEGDDDTPLMEWWQETGTGQPNSAQKQDEAPQKYVVRAGSLRCLVNQLIVQNQSDPDYMVDFLRTYRYFTESVDIGRLLVLRYLEVGWIIEPGISNDINLGIEKLKKIVAAAGGNTSAPSGAELASFLQLRLLNVFKKWINDHPIDFAKSGILQELVTSFLTQYVKTDARKTVFADSMLKALEEKMSAYRSMYGSAPTALFSMHAGHGGSNPALNRVKHQSLAPGGSSSVTASSNALNVPSAQPNGRPKTISEAGSLDKLSNMGSAHGSSSNLFSFSHGSMKRAPGDHRGSMNFSSIATTLSSLTSLKSIASTGSEKEDRESEKFTSTPDISLGSSLRRGSRSPHVGSMANITEKTEKDNPLSFALALSMLEPPKITLADIDPEKLAEQLTLIEHAQFKRIRVDEFYCQSWNKKGETRDSGNRLRGLISWFNKVAYGAATEVVMAQKLKDRVSVLKRLIYTADCCLKWNNFNTAFEIVAGLNLGPVSRLKKTWKALPTKYMDSWNSLNSILSHEGSHKNYRAKLASLKERSTNTAILPYLGVNLQDLTFTEDGNPTFLAETPNSTQSQLSTPETPRDTSDKLINFSKFRMISRLLQNIMDYQKGEYTFNADDGIQDFLKTGWRALDNAGLYEQSKLCEPRVAA